MLVTFMPKHLRSCFTTQDISDTTASYILQSIAACYGCRNCVPVSTSAGLFFVGHGDLVIEFICASQYFALPSSVCFSGTYRPA